MMFDNIIEVTAETDLESLDLTKSNFLYVFDHIPPLPLCPNHIEAMLSGKTSFDHIFDYAKNENPELFFIFEDCLGFENKDNLNFIFLNNIFIWAVSDLLYFNFAKPQLTKKILNKNFTFLSNNRRPHRALISCWIENFAKDLDFNYSSLAVVPNMLEELTLHNSATLDTTKTLKEKFLFTSNCLQSKPGDPSNRIRYRNNFQNFLNTRVLYENTALSIVSESIFYENSFMLTEKSLNAWLEGHMIIWPAGWKSAHYVKELGFDVFDDILDHSYQHIDNPVDRTLQALELNKNIIFNKSLQEQFYNDNIERFQHNIDLCYSIDTLVDNSLKLNDPLLLQKFINTCSKPSKNLINAYREKFNFPKTTYRPVLS